MWATSWENLFMPYANNKGADQPAHPRNLISTFVFHCLDTCSIISLVSITEISSLQLVSVAEQAGLSLTWLQTPKTCFLMMRPNVIHVHSWLGVNVGVQFSVHMVSMQLSTSTLASTLEVKLNHLMRLWYFSSSANSSFKCACTAIQWG